MNETYEIDDGRIRCRVCDRASADPHDLERLYCGNCKLFHANAQAGVASIAAGLALLAPWLAEDERDRLLNVWLASVKIRREGCLHG